MSSINKSLLYLAILSDLEREPVFIWPAFVATARSAIVVSSVSPDLLDMPLHTLSGGERARIAIAHLMLQPADLLLLDEPTNDLDIPTLETLEASLLDFPGAIVLITHDRCMMDRICNSLLSLGEPLKEASAMPKQKESAPAKPKSPNVERKQVKEIEGKITRLEKEVKKLTHELEDPTIAEDPAALNKICQLIGSAEAKIEQLYIQWEEIDQE